MPHFAKHNYEAYIILEQVVTVEEAARRLKKPRTSIDRAIDSNNIPAVKSGKNTLVHLPSAVRWFTRSTRA